MSVCLHMTTLYTYIHMKMCMLYTHMIEIGVKVLSSQADSADEAGFMIFAVYSGTELIFDPEPRSQDGFKILYAP